MRNITLCLLGAFLVCALQACKPMPDSGTTTAADIKLEQPVTYDLPQEEGDAASDALEPPAPQGALLRLAVIGDMNGNYGSSEYAPEITAAIDRIIAQKPDIVINVGDMVAGQRSGLNYRAMWEAFHGLVTQRLLDAGVLMAQTPGNHDASGYAPYVKEREIYIEQWSARKPALSYVDDTMYPLYYSFTLNGVLFIALDATTLEPLDDVQYAWLEAQLTQNSQKMPVVVFGHVPLFSITTIKASETLRDPRLQPLFEKYAIKLFITGHQHAYFPAHSQGISYLHAGALGGGPRPVRFNTGVAPKTLSFVSIYADQKPAYETYAMDEGERRIRLNRLPTYLKLPQSILARYDITEEDALFAHQHWISAHLTHSQMKMLIEAYKTFGLSYETIPEWELSYDMNGQIVDRFDELSNSGVYDDPAYRDLIR